MHPLEYLFHICLGPTDWERSNELTERASELWISLRTPEEILPEPSPVEFLLYVRQYALDLIAK